MKLVIVESPAKCGKIQGYLGEDYQVIATMGHIRALEETLEAVGIDRDFDARYEFLSTKARAIKQIKEAAASADQILLASDDDREGEAISYAVALLLRLPVATTPRIVFHEITKQAIRAAVAAPRTIDMNRVSAQQARSILDLMVGFTISPLLWRHVAPSLSAGRCQTPALRLVIERENQIGDFRGSSSWRVSGKWTPSTVDRGVPAQPAPATMDDDLEDEESALNYLENIATPPTNATITAASTKQWSTPPPPPLITSTLQQQASALFHINPKTTMQSAQRLYEQGHITYMRTDKAVLSQEAKDQVWAYIDNTYGAQYVNRDEIGATVTAAASSPAAQEAHEAIRPTNITLSTLPDTNASHQDHKIYGLIWQRTIQSQMTAAQGETFAIKFVAGTAPDFPWSASWRRTTFLGWQRIGKVADIDAEDGDVEDIHGVEDNFSVLQRTYTPGTVLRWCSLAASPHELRQPPRYTEATLVRELEKHGIGRPSTFATLIAAIQDKGYAEIKNFDGKKVPVKSHILSTVGQWPPTTVQTIRSQGAERQRLAPTDLGRTVLQFLLANFSDLFAYDFTGQVEERLDRIAAGQEPYKQVLRDVWGSYKDRYNSLKTNVASTSATTERQKVFNGGLKAVITKKGPLLLTEGSGSGAPTTFHGWPQGITFQDITEEQAVAYVQAHANTTIGTWRGYPIEHRTGKFGPYVVAGPHTVSITEADTVEIICAKLDARAAVPSSSATPIAKFKEFEIRNGPYGPYILKPKLKTQKFVSLPKTIKDPAALSEKEVEALYKAGLEQKARSKKYLNNKQNEQRR